MAKSLISFLKTQVSADCVARKRDGSKNIIFYRGYYYTHGQTSAWFGERVGQRLTELGLKWELITTNRQHKPFVGGQSVVQGSHFSATFHIDEPTRNALKML